MLGKTGHRELFPQVTRVIKTKIISALLYKENHFFPPPIISKTAAANPPHIPTVTGKGGSLPAEITKTKSIQGPGSVFNLKLKGNGAYCRSPAQMHKQTAHLLVKFLSFHGLTVIERVFPQK